MPGWTFHLFFILCTENIEIWILIHKSKQEYWICRSTQIESNQ